MITIKAKTRNRELTKFNEQILQKGKNLPHYPIILYVRDRGKTYYLNTGLATSNVNMDGTEFKDKDRTKLENLELTNRLQKMLRDCNDYALKHERQSVDMLKDGLTRIIKGKGMGCVGGLTDAVMRYIELHNLRSATRTMYEGLAKKIEVYDKGASMDSVDVDWLNGFEEYMDDDGLAVNSIAIYMRCLRAVFKWAHKPSVMLTSNRVFEDYSIKTEKVSKFTMTAQQLADFRDYPCEPWQQRYKDMAMLSFYMAGINVGDLCSVIELVNGRLEYERQKTGADYNLPIVREAREILERYKGEEHLLDVMDGRADYHSFTKLWNKALKKIGLSELVKDKRGVRQKVVYHPLFPELTTYTFRYSFATIANDEVGVSIENIGKCLGHAWATRGNVTLEHYINRQRKQIDSTIEAVVEYMRGIKGRPKEVIDAEIRVRDGME